MVDFNPDCTTHDKPAHCYRYILSVYLLSFKGLFMEPLATALPVPENIVRVKMIPIYS